MSQLEKFGVEGFREAGIFIYMTISVFSFRAVSIALNIVFSVRFEIFKFPICNIGDVLKKIIVNFWPPGPALLSRARRELFKLSDQDIFGYCI